LVAFNDVEVTNFLAFKPVCTESLTVCQNDKQCQSVETKRQNYSFTVNVQSVLHSKLQHRSSVALIALMSISFCGRLFQITCSASSAAMQSSIFVKIKKNRTNVITVNLVFTARPHCRALLYLQQFRPSVRPSVCPSVRLSVTRWCPI